MSDENNQSQINEINKKLDFIIEEIALQKKQRQAFEDLQDDLTRVGKDVYKTAVDELEELHDYFTPSDLFFLSKKLMRNIKTITATVEQIESAKDFIEDFVPISRDMVIEFMHRLDDYDRKGYFDFIRELFNIVDKIITSFSPDEIKNISSNVPVLISTFKNLSDPLLLNSLNNIISAYRDFDKTTDKNISLMRIISELNKPDTKQGILFTLKILQNLKEIKAK